MVQRSTRARRDGFHAPGAAGSEARFRRRANPEVVRKAFAAALLAAEIVATPATAAQHGYLFSVVGRVVSADRARGTLVLRHGMLETMAPGTETCRVPTAALRIVRPGMMIQATADTRHHPWRLLDLRLFRSHPDRPGNVNAVLASAGLTR